MQSIARQKPAPRESSEPPFYNNWRIAPLDPAGGHLSPRPPDNFIDLPYLPLPGKNPAGAHVFNGVVISTYCVLSHHSDIYCTNACCIMSYLTFLSEK